MGCLCTRNENKEVPHEDVVQTKTYSWDEKKKSVDKQNLIVENLTDQEVIKLPGTVNGEQFIIQNCKDSSVYVLDHINTITIDDCTNCNIVLGPVQGSAFIRNCMSCTCVLACGQFRVRDSTKINVFLFSATQPIIEASTGMNFGSYQLNYNGIKEHFEKSNLNCSIKNWEHIYDFTPTEFEKNWSFVKDDCVRNFIPEPKSETLKNELNKLHQFWCPIEKSGTDTQNSS